MREFIMSIGLNGLLSMAVWGLIGVLCARKIGGFVSGMAAVFILSLLLMSASLHTMGCEMVFRWNAMTNAAPFTGNAGPYIQAVFDIVTLTVHLCADVLAVPVITAFLSGLDKGSDNAFAALREELDISLGACEDLGRAFKALGFSDDEGYGVPKPAHSKGISAFPAGRQEGGSNNCS